MNPSHIKFIGGLCTGSILGVGVGWLVTVITEKRLIYYIEYYFPQRYNPYVKYHGDYNYSWDRSNDKLYIKHCNENDAYYNYLRSKIRSSASDKRTVTKYE